MGLMPIPAFLLKHSAVLTTVFSSDLWGRETENISTELTNVRIEPVKKSITDKNFQQITLSAILFFSPQISSCLVPFLLEGDTYEDKTVKNQFVTFCGRNYSVVQVKEYYPDDVHHIEVSLV